ncbi:DUF924 family protein [Hydrocarboniclastica marina]|uniref:DUF924 domain-containing protein n=1 Tax=Hydrocarboniclastica marina TaxID=2259620 RepID=A0A4P7XHF3_9ALTE|nr:DUF924 family protein [Hydrocarboniclastica marina]QCF25884.1 DUF924 domain-containing protein [Hydrocarboniclastica marina]
MIEWQHILEFWFGPMDGNGLPDRAHRERWFRVDRAFDREIRRRFLTMMLVASEGGLEPWRKYPGGRLAEIILLDQVPRNIYRGTALVYSHDALARNCCREGLEKAADVELPLIGRAFFYMPLQHSEKRADQNQAAGLYEQLVALAPAGPARDTLDAFYRSAQNHRRIIERFGRFPHRNRILKRTSTAEEVEFLAAGADDFGQSGG